MQFGIGCDYVAISTYRDANVVSGEKELGLHVDDVQGEKENVPGAQNKKNVA